MLVGCRGRLDAPSVLSPTPRIATLTHRRAHNFFVVFGLLRELYGREMS
jgi:hypothetical protein